MPRGGPAGDQAAAAAEGGNTDHPVFEVMKAAQDAGDREKVARYARMLYNQALLVEGMPIEDPVEFAKDIADLMR